MSRAWLALRRVHRWCGLVAAIGVGWLALTAVPLALDDALSLARRPAPGWIAGLYGLDPVAREIVAGRHVLRGGPEGWHVDDTLVSPAPGEPLALLQARGTWFAIGTAGVALLDDDARLLETGLAPLADVDRIAGAAIEAGAVCVHDAQGRRACTADGASWQAAPARPVRVVAAPADASAAPITLERVLLDLHALRFAGPLAPWLGAVLALSIAFLAVSGTASALAGRRRRVPNVRRP